METIKKVLIGIGGFVVLMLVLGAILGNEGNDTSKASPGLDEQMASKQPAKPATVASDTPAVANKSCNDAALNIARIMKAEGRDDADESAIKFHEVCSDVWPENLTGCFAKAKGPQDMIPCSEYLSALNEAMTALDPPATPAKRKAMAKLWSYMFETIVTTRGAGAKTLRMTASGCSESDEALQAVIDSMPALEALKFVKLECHNGERVVSSKKLQH